MILRFFSFPLYIYIYIYVLPLTNTNFVSPVSIRSMFRSHLPSLGIKYIYCFYVLLSVHLSIILAIDQLNTQILVFLISLLYSSTCFEHCCAHHQEVKLYYTASGIVTLCRWPSGVHLRTGRPPTERNIINLLKKKKEFVY